MPRLRQNIGRRARGITRVNTFRSQQTQEERAAEIEQNIYRASRLRENFTQQQRKIRNEEQRLRTRQARTAINNTNRIIFTRLAFDYDPALDYNLYHNIDIGRMDQQITMGVAKHTGCS